MVSTVYLVIPPLPCFPSLTFAKTQSHSISAHSPQSHQEPPHPCRSIFSLECMGLPKERKLSCVLGSLHPGMRVSNFSSCANGPPVQIISWPPSHVFLLPLFPSSLTSFKMWNVLCTWSVKNNLINIHVLITWIEQISAFCHFLLTIFYLWWNKSLQIHLSRFNFLFPERHPLVIFKERIPFFFPWKMGSFNPHSWMII